MKANRKEIGIIFGSEPKFNSEAFKFFILSLNKVQNLFEFYFPDTKGFPFNDKYYTEKSLDNFHNNKIKLFNQEPHHWIIILTNKIENNYFSLHLNNCSFITTYGWEKYFSPPSLIEYLFNSILTSILIKDTDFELDFHSETRGSLFDYKRKKIDAKTSVSLGYIGDKEKNIIKKIISDDYYIEIEKLLNREWIGDKNNFGSIAYILKKNFDYDIQRDSGYKKNIFKKLADKLHDLPFELIKIIIQTIFGILLAYLLIRLGLQEDPNEINVQSPKQEEINIQ